MPRTTKCIAAKHQCMTFGYTILLPNALLVTDAIHLVNSVGSSDAFAAGATWKLRPHPLLKNLKLYFQFLYPCIATLKRWCFSNYASAAKTPEKFLNVSYSCLWKIMI